jgi:phosphoribosylformylglycinamidine cyclo-ligase
MTTSTEQTYAGSGVDYSAMDPIKVLAQQTAAATAVNLRSFEAEEIVASRGESAYVWEEPDAYRALVVEGLGTKNLVADVVRSYTGKSHYDSIAQDTVAMIVNDLIVVGALPQVVNAYFAIGDSSWMLDKERASDLISGWAHACQESEATWGGGETPTLKGIINPATIDLAGSAIGIINPKQRLVLGDKLAAGDVIVLIESSGIHANGITFVRSLVEKTPGLYERRLSDGRSFGEAILTPRICMSSLFERSWRPSWTCTIW